MQGDTTAVPLNTIPIMQPVLRSRGLLEPVYFGRSRSRSEGAAPGFVSSEMPDNCLRHSFATYHLALHKSEDLTSRLMGNSPGVLRDNYEALVLRAPRLAPEWFKVKP